jgi:hypothetical protein
VLVSTFRLDVTAGQMSYSQLRNQFQAKNSIIFGLSHIHGCTNTLTLPTRNTIQLLEHIINF